MSFNNIIMNNKIELIENYDYHFPPLPSKIWWYDHNIADEIKQLSFTTQQNYNINHEINPPIYTVFHNNTDKNENQKQPQTIKYIHTKQNKERTIGSYSLSNNEILYISQEVRKNVGHRKNTNKIIREHIGQTTIKNMNNPPNEQKISPKRKNNLFQKYINPIVNELKEDIQSKQIQQYEKQKRKREEKKINNERIKNQKVNHVKQEPSSNAKYVNRTIIARIDTAKVHLLKSFIKNYNELYNKIYNKTNQLINRTNDLLLQKEKIKDMVRVEFSMNISYGEYKELYGEYVKPRIPPDYKGLSDLEQVAIDNCISNHKTNITNLERGNQQPGSIKEKNNEVPIKLPYPLVKMTYSNSEYKIIIDENFFNKLTNDYENHNNNSNNVFDLSKKNK